MVAVKKSKPPNDAALESEIASFASTLGFSSAAPSSGFNDADFRKSGSIKAKHQPIPKPAKAPAPEIKNRKTNPPRNNKPFQNQKRESVKLNSNLLEQHDYNKYKNLPKLPLVKSGALAVWYSDAAELEEKLIGKEKKIEFKDVDEWKSLVEKKKELGERLLAQYAQEYSSSRGKHGDIKMLYTTQRSGTAADKVSALSVLIGDNAVANLRSIDALLGMVTSKVGKRHAFTAFEALKEMFLILLPDRKLKTLSQRPLNHLSDTKDGYSLLLFWYWEECLKDRYEQFVSALQEASLDVIAKLKSLALKTIFTLLKSKSEQERRLLASLVNKLGDPENKVASNADYHLANLLAEHPNMKTVVIDEVDNFLFRPHLGLRSKYTAVNFLTQIRLSHKADGPKAAKRLIDIYFALFKVLISEAGAAPSSAKTNKEASSSSKEGKTKPTSEPHVEMDSRLLSALLTGVNRAFPYVASDEADSVVESQTPLLFHLVHSKNFNVGVQALMLLDKISSKNQIVSDRFYRALYSKLLLPAAMNSSKEEMFFALLLRAMKNDINVKRVAAFSKRLLQVALQLPPQYACGCLFLLSEVLKARPPLWNMVLQNEAADADDDLEHFEDITENDDATVPASDIKDKTNQVADTNNKSDDDSEEEAPDESGSEASGSDDDGLNEPDDIHGEGGLNKLMAMKSTNKPKQLKSTADPEVQNPQSLTTPGGYDPRHREPSYCNADRVGWWELTALATHVHPSVAAMAGTLLSGVNIVYNGNPLSDLSLVAFLDKFMEKKPKQSTWHGASQIEPAKKVEMNHQLIGAEILSLAEADVPPEDVVFHKFYMNKMSSTKKPKKKKKKTEEEEAAEELYAADGVEDDSDNEEMDTVVDESDNDEIDNVLDSADPLEAEGDYDYDNLDKIADEDDEDLIGEASDEEIGIPSDDEGGSIDDSEDDGDDDDVDVVVGEGDDGSDGEDRFEQVKKRKRKTGASPFASLEEYEHLMEDEDPADAASPETKRPKSKENKNKRKKKKKKNLMEDEDPADASDESPETKRPKSKENKKKSKKKKKKNVS